MTTAEAAQVNIHAAKTHFSRLVERAEAGEEIVIARAGKPVATLAPIGDRPPPGKRGRGSLRGKITIHDDFDELPADVAAAFGMIDES